MFHVERCNSNWLNVDPIEHAKSTLSKSLTNKMRIVKFCVLRSLSTDVTSLNFCVWFQRA